MLLRGIRELVQDPPLGHSLWGNQLRHPRCFKPPEPEQSPGTAPGSSTHSPDSPLSPRTPPVRVSWIHGLPLQGARNSCNTQHAAGLGPGFSGAIALYAKCTDLNKSHKTYTHVPASVFSPPRSILRVGVRVFGGIQSPSAAAFGFSTMEPLSPHLSLL